MIATGDHSLNPHHFMGRASQPGRCFRMIYDHKLQATHCRQPPAWKGVWRDAKGKSWYVEACRKHAPKLRSGGAK